MNPGWQHPPRQPGSWNKRTPQSATSTSVFPGQRRSGVSHEVAASEGEGPDRAHTSCLPRFAPPSKYSESASVDQFLMSVPSAARVVDEHQCVTCGAKFQTRYGLCLHERKKHQGAPRYRCHLCGGGFMMKGHYIGHMNMHNNVKTFECQRCPRKFAYKSSLKYHMKECKGRADADTARS